MARKAKYPGQKLTKEDKELIAQIALRYAVKFYVFYSKYRDPKNFALRMINLIRHNTHLAAIHTMAMAKNASSDQLLRPREINQRITETIEMGIQQDLEDLILSDGSHDFFLNPRDLTKVLKQLEKMGIFLNIRTRNKIRELERGKRCPGKNPHQDKDPGGKPSVYKLTEEFEKLKNVIEKPEAVEILYEEIAKSGLAHKLIRFLLLAFWHAAKMDEKYFGTGVGYGAALFQDTLEEEDRIKFKAIHKSLQELDNRQLEQLADGYVDLILHDSRFYQALIFSLNFLKL
jgi:hypothetical protein